MVNRWDMAGKRALLTGATKGIGRAIAEEFLSLGAEVLIVARTPEGIDEQLSEWRQKGWRANGIAAEVGNAEDHKKIFNRVDELWSTLDILVNNVGTNIRKKILE